MGDSIDNIKGVPGIGEKGARDLIAEHGDLDTLLAHAASVSNKRYREGLLAHADDARQSRELARIRIDVPVEFQPETLRFRGASRERCFELFTRLGFRTLVMEYAPTADTIGKDYAVIASLDERRRARWAAARRRPIRPARDSGCAVRDARGHRRLVAVGGAAQPRATFPCHRTRPLPRMSQRACSEHRRRPVRDPRRTGRGDARIVERARSLEAAARGCVRGEDRPRPQIRRDCPRPARRHAAWAGHGHDAGQLPAECDPLVTPARGAFARARRLQGAD